LEPRAVATLYREVRVSSQEHPVSDKETRD
jgi:hypothetical protein